MALNKTRLSQDIINNMLSGKPDNANDAQRIMGDTIKKHIEENIEITFSWIAFNPGGFPDPVITFKGKINFTSFKLLPSPNIIAYGLQIGAIVGTGIVTPEDSKFAVTPTTLLPTPIILTESKADNQKDAMEYFSDELIKGIKLKLNPIPVTGIRTTIAMIYTGTGIMNRVR